MSVKQRAQMGAPLPGLAGGAKKPLSRIIFDKFDHDNSGTIDQSEFRDLCYDLGYFISDDQVKEAVKNQIQYDDFLKWWSTQDRFKTLQLDDESLAQRQVASELFQKFDADKNGTIDKKKKLTTKSEDKALEDLDSDRNGTSHGWSASALSQSRRSYQT